MANRNHFDNFKAARSWWQNGQKQQILAELLRKRVLRCHMSMASLRFAIYLLALSVLGIDRAHAMVGTLNSIDSSKQAIR
jgi:hypothetical protein